MQSCLLTPVLAEQLGDGLAVRQAISPSKDCIEPGIIVHIGAGDGAASLACVQCMSLPQLQESQLL